MIKHKHMLGMLIAAGFIGAWLLFNPIGRFGLHSFGLTVYSGIPFPVIDLMITKNGWPIPRRHKSHVIYHSEIQELLLSKENIDVPEFIILRGGWDNKVHVDQSVFKYPVPPVEVLSTPKAIERYNELRRTGHTVAAIIHSTC